MSAPGIEAGGRRTGRAAFSASLLDPRGRPEVVVGGAGHRRLVWTLANKAHAAGQALVVTPFEPGEVGPERHHFRFGFAPGAMTAAPEVAGWEVAAEADGRGAITALYVALAGPVPLSLAPRESARVEWTYAFAVREDAGSDRVAVTLAAGGNVTLGGVPIQGKQFGPFDLALVPAEASVAGPPIAVDFVGRRTVLNDGRTPNTFTFAVTNLTPAELALGTASGFDVWFDAAPNHPAHPYPWALAQVQDLAARTVALSAPGRGWQVRLSAGAALGVEENPRWTVTPAAPLVLPPQSPVLFTFSGIVTDLEPGVTRMYLHFRDLPGYADGILVAELEKSPLLYGAGRGQGMYLAAGVPSGPTPPAPDFASGLHVRQHGPGPAATLSGGAGLVVEDAGDVAARFEGGVAVTASSGEPALSVAQGGKGPAARIKGATALDGALNVAGTATVAGPLTARGDASAASLRVRGEAGAGSLTVQGNATVGGELKAERGAEVRGRISVAGPVSLLGKYQSIQPDTVYRASTDGLVVASLLPTFVATVRGLLQGHVDGRVVTQTAGGFLPMGPGPSNLAASIVFPVPAGSTWKVVYEPGPKPEQPEFFRIPGQVTGFWIPFGTAQGT